MPRQNISGQVFNHLTPVTPTTERLSGSVLWLCRCSCGAMTRASASQLRSGKKKSCGHILADVHKHSGELRLGKSNPAVRTLRNANGKLSTHDVLTIRKLAAKGLSATEILEQLDLDICVAYCYSVMNGSTHMWLRDQEGITNEETNQTGS